MYFAKINEENIVEQVIVADEQFVTQLSGTWIETDINGVSPKNYAGIGYIFDEAKNAFISPKPFPSWVLNEETCQWESPIPRPEGNYIWNEDEQNWQEI